MVIVASGQINLVDLSDDRQLSISIGSSSPRVQTYDPNSGSYTPNWTTSPVVLKPSLYINDEPLALNATGLTIIWKRKEGSAAETALSANETVANNILTINANKLSSISSKMLTYIIYVTYLDPETDQIINKSADIPFHLINNAMNAHTVAINGEQVFKYDKNNSLVSAAQITLTAVNAGVTISKWQYKNSAGVWTNYPTTSDNANITSSILVVKPTHAVFFNNTAQIKVVTSDANVTDTISITKLYDGTTGEMGADGNDAYTVILTNEAQVLAANKDGACSAVKVISKVIAYKGTTKITPIVANPTGLPTGMTFTQATANNEVTCTFTVAANATLAGLDAGTIDLDITVDGQIFRKTFSWTKSKTGATGNTGAAGQNAVVFSIYAPQGSYVQNNEGQITLNTSAYNGSTEILSGATYQWAKLVNGSYQNVSGATSKSLIVKGMDVQNIETYQCTMMYAGKKYFDTITVEDKTDMLSTYIYSTNGNIFKNKQGESVFQVYLYANGNEVDELLSTNISATVPASPKAGDFWYKLDKTTKTIVLQKYSGSTWAPATEKQAYTYNWYRIGKDGKPIDTATPFKSGKVIYVTAADLEGHTIFDLQIDDGK